MVFILTASDFGTNGLKSSLKWLMEIRLKCTKSKLEVVDIGQETSKDFRLLLFHYGVAMVRLWVHEGVKLQLHRRLLLRTG